MGNCLSTCTKSSETSNNGDFDKTDLVIVDTKQGIYSDTKSPKNVSVEQVTKIQVLVQNELAALQEQISRSQAILTSLKSGISSDLQDDVAPEIKQEIIKIHRTTQTLIQEVQPKSLECVSSNDKSGWDQQVGITSSCPAIVNTAVQTDADDDSPNQTLGQDSKEYFLPPISPPDSQVKDYKEIANKSFDSRGSRDIDLDIYRSCRKLSVLPEEEVAVEEIPSPPYSAAHRLAPTNYPHQQTHSFESYLLPEEESQRNSNVKRQLSDPTPSPDIHPKSRRSSRSTCRPLQIRQALKEDANKESDNYFCFPDIKPIKITSSITEKLVKRQNSKGTIGLNVTQMNPDDETCFENSRITSPTYGILQDTVSQLITISDASFEQNFDSSFANGVNNLSVPNYIVQSSDTSPYKTPLDTSIVSTPGFFTPQSISSDFKKSSDSSSNTSSSFQTPLNSSPNETNESFKSYSATSSLYKTPMETLANSSQSSAYSSPHSRKKHHSPLINIIPESISTYVSDPSNVQNNLYARPISDAYKHNRTMLSILMDSPRDQNRDNILEPIHSKLCCVNGEESNDRSSSQTVETTLVVPNTCVYSNNEAGTVNRAPSRRRLQRSLVRISSQTPLELVDISEPAAVVQTPVEVKDTPEGLVMRRTTSELGGLGVHGTPLISSHSFPSLSDQVLKTLGAWMQDASADKANDTNSEEDIENTFTSLIIAFKTDKLTLSTRLELQNRVRDQAEHNMTNEVLRLKADIQKLSPLCIDSEKMELLEKIVEQVDAMQKSTIRVSSSAEMYGAVQQENRLSKAVDVILRHVENLKQAYDKEKTEHEDARRLLVENKSPAAILKLNQSTKRRASIATVPRSQTNPDTTKSMSSPAEVKGGRTRLNSIPRRISDVISEAEHSKEHASEEQSKEQKENKEQTDVQKTTPTNTTSLNSIRLTIRKPSGIIEDPSHGGETESEDEQDLEGLGKERMSLTKSDSRLSLFSQRYNSSYNRRSSLKCSWMNKLTSHIHWIQPVDQLLLQVRYGVAAMLLIAAVGVFTSAFFLPNNR